jgi:uncharacterized protein YegP (UPF0339 family)
MTETTDRVEVYTDAKGEYRWRRVARNNKIVSDSAEGFTTRSYAEQSARSYNADVERIDDQTGS